jgi:fucose 4-O-acetylase-like acetyltransferase
MSGVKDGAVGRSGRIDWIDMAKGYGILFVIFAHLGVRYIGSWIYTFHMPLFFFLSGYVFSTKYDFKTFVKRRYESIIIPYFSLGIVLVAFLIIQQCYQGNFDIYTSVFDSMVYCMPVFPEYCVLWIDKEVSDRPEFIFSGNGYADRWTGLLSFWRDCFAVEC